LRRSGHTLLPIFWEHATSMTTLVILLVGSVFFLSMIFLLSLVMLRGHWGEIAKDEEEKARSQGTERL
jgi:hypothetical protein